MSVPITIETFAVDGTPQSVMPILVLIDSRCVERENVSSSYSIIPGYASADCYEDASQVGSFLDPRSVSIEVYVKDAPRIAGKFEDTVITAESIADAPMDYTESQALAESAELFVDPEDSASQGVARITKSITVVVEDGAVGYSFTPKLESVFTTAASVGTFDTEKTAEPLRFTANVDKYFSPDEVAFDERLDDVSITATVTGVFTKEPLKPKVIEAYSGQSPDDDTIGKVGNTQGFFWG